jgi:unsaturated rhamnogalacturonyl hydrolase
MQGPFYARYAAEFGTETDLADVISQLVLVESKTRDEKTGLMYHAWDESCSQLWADPATGCSPHFWGRAMGWYCMAILDILDYVPETARFRSSRERLSDIVTRLCTAVTAVQDKKTGLWYQILDLPQREKNYLETSASAMFVYFLFKLVRIGAIELSDMQKNAVLSAAEKGWKGLLGRISEDAAGILHLDGICSVAGLGGNPYRDGSFGYYIKEPIVRDDFKGIGPFIFAALEAESAGF